MKKVVPLCFLIAMLAIPCIGLGQLGNSREVTIGQPTQQPTTNVIGLAILNEVLTLAAPQFGFTPEDFIRMYGSCDCITVTEISPGVYLVVYGGIGIQIVIDGCRNSGPVNTGTPGSRKH